MARAHRDLKVRLASTHRFDLDGYTLAEAPFIEEVLKIL
ncbi:MAG: hypothetical protein JXB46_06595 [Candidatus Eisenbacteria bacterium]|nr:hypothetical protein [Candidatus Eisenbacteria bacterium]